MKLTEGVYENLINGHLANDMKQTEAEGLVCKTEEIDAAESSKMLADFLSDAIRKKLEDADTAVEDKINFVNDILDSTDLDENEKLIDAPKLLAAVINQQKNEELKATKRNIIKPLSGFRTSLHRWTRRCLSWRGNLTRYCFCRQHLHHCFLSSSLWHPHDARRIEKVL